MIPHSQPVIDIGSIVSLGGISPSIENFRAILYKLNLPKFSHEQVSRTHEKKFHLIFLIVLEIDSLVALLHFIHHLANDTPKVFEKSIDVLQHLYILFPLESHANVITHQRLRNGVRDAVCSLTLLLFKNDFKMFKLVFQEMILLLKGII